MVYLVAGGVLIGLGIGSCGQRRWARALSLVVGWSWLAVGAISVVMMTVLLPRILKASQPNGQQMPGAVQLVAMVTALVFLAIFFIAVPAVLVFFYQSRHVKATCEARSPAAWTDLCPLPLLTLCLWLGLGALMMLIVPLGSRGVIPLFGHLFSGPLGFACYALIAFLWGFSAWLLFRLRPSGWWLALVTICVMTASAVFTLSQIDLADMYRQMGYGEQQVQLIQQSGLLKAPGMPYLAFSGAIPLLVLLIVTKRFLRPQAGTLTGVSPG